MKNGIIATIGLLLFLIASILGACSPAGPSEPTTTIINEQPPATETRPPIIQSTETETPEATPTKEPTVTQSPIPQPMDTPTATPLPRIPYDGAGLLAYVANPGSSVEVMEIFLMTADGKETRQLTDLGYLIAAPTWSPDGSLIAFMARVDFESPLNIYIVNVEGATNVRQLTDTDANDQYPAWAPDGRWIAFSSDRDGDAEIFLMDPTGGNIQQLTSNEWPDENPDWSPDGTKIAYESAPQRNTQIFNLNVSEALEGLQEAVQSITTNEYNDYAPAWSPSGDQIAFHSVRGGPPEIFVMNADGSDVHQLTFLGANAWWADWAPDGRWLVFSYFDRRNEFASLHEIYTVSPDISLPWRLTNSPTDDWYPAWGP